MRKAVLCEDMSQQERLGGQGVGRDNQSGEEGQQVLGERGGFEGW